MFDMIGKGDLRVRRFIPRRDVRRDHICVLSRWKTRPRSSQHLPSAQTWTRAKALQKGAQTPMLAWFSTVAGEPGAADAERDVRGFALKFHKASEGRFKHQIMNRFDASICRV